MPKEKRRKDVSPDGHKHLNKTTRRPDTPPEQPNFDDNGADNKALERKKSEKLLFEPRDGYTAKSEAVNVTKKRFSHISSSDGKVNLFISGTSIFRSLDGVKKIHDGSYAIELSDGNSVNLNKILDVRSLKTQRGEMFPDWMPYLVAANVLNDLVEKAQSKSNGSASVLVHCRHGFERSVSAVLLYLMAYQSHSYSDAAGILDQALANGRGEDAAASYRLNSTADEDKKRDTHAAKVISDFSGIEKGVMNQIMENFTDIVKFSFVTKGKSIENIGQEKTNDSAIIKIKKPTQLVVRQTQFRGLIVEGKRIEDVLKPEVLEDFRTYRQQQNSVESTHETLSEKSNISTESKTEVTDEQQSTVTRDARSDSMNSVAARGSSLADKRKALREEAQALGNPEVSENDSNQSTPSAPPSPR